MAGGLLWRATFGWTIEKLLKLDDRFFDLISFVVSEHSTSFVNKRGS